ncbi:hypothetical protein P168DRAFT_317065 [Aspergillus campestris IBT 28561]|uniref:HNH nuclease domain-containing protein n=1 Tax=Aspergillus campestris (strain IBT 28561) TaxID=1392248 RepID=A0A2I1D6N4_ASPC2|nr:uncharacterized protein P168DRAFT_317065 [Aspergillus campestris IBT 28561]PKY05542.1 hypothetical protein P168DRAFT_317065 [Aspergillus campestris IBT 28561]
MSGDSCWACEIANSQAVYVVAREDMQEPLWRDQGLLNFSLTSADNGIPLCSTCQYLFERPDDPGFVFIPADLQYFIDFELKDRENRELAARNGEALSRQVPSSDMYREHQLKQGAIEAEAAGGLYKRVFLTNYSAGELIDPEEHGLTGLKVWHGAPLATLRRGIHALGSARVYQMDPKTIAQLETLRSLYFKCTRESSLEVRSTQAQPDLQRKEREAREEDEFGVPSNLKMLKIEHHHLYTDFEDRPIPQEEWTFTPKLTTGEIIDRYLDAVRSP